MQVDQPLLTMPKSPLKPLQIDCLLFRQPGFTLLGFLVYQNSMQAIKIVVLGKQYPNTLIKQWRIKCNKSKQLNKHWK
jgi:hypothetical protein